ncbi:MAG: hypothetical protein AB7G37_04585 [Solirubrobacteraceae bacterium]
MLPHRSRSRAARSARHLAVVLCTIAALPASMAHAQPARDAGAISAYLDRPIQGWAALQDPSTGDLRDPSPARGMAGYGQSMIGMTFILQGLRSGDDGLVDKGIRAFDRLVFEHRDDGLPFDMMVFPDAYRRLDVAGYRSATWTARRAFWARYLSQWNGVPVERQSGCYANPNCFHNWLTVNALGDQLLLLTGVPGAPGTLAGDPPRLVAQIEDLVNVRGNRAARSFATDTPYGPAAYVTDGGAKPMAYAAFTAAHLGMISYVAPQTVKEELSARAARYLLAIQGPDGDVSWVGRSYEQSWTLAAAAFTGIVSAVTDPRNRDAHLRGAARAWGSLPTVAPASVHDTLAITPSSRDADGSLAGLDSYASHPEYNGLLMMYLAYAVDVLERHPDVAAAFSAARPLDTGPPRSFRHAKAGLAWARRGSMWVGVHGRSGGRVPDGRYSPGIAQIKTKRRGRWINLTDGLPFHGPQPGIGLRRKGVTTPVRLGLLRATSKGFKATATFATASGAIRHRTTMYFSVTGSRVTVRFTMPRKSSWQVTQSLTGAVARKRSLATRRLRMVSPRDDMRVISRSSEPTALSTQSEQIVWRSNRSRRKRTVILEYVRR